VIVERGQCGDCQEVIVLDVQPLESVLLDVAGKWIDIHPQPPNRDLDRDLPQGATADEDRLRRKAYELLGLVRQARIVRLPL
jgi:hypothetical protein